MVFTSPFGEADCRLFSSVKSMGYDVFEISYEYPNPFKPGLVAQAAKDYGIDLLISGAFGEDRDMSNEDPAVRRSTLDFIKSGIDLAAAVGSPHFAGPMYAATGKARLLSEEGRRQQWKWAEDGLRQAAIYGGERNVSLAIEPLNRYETDMINTVAQGLELCQQIGLPNVGLMLDTYHMNIEEKSVSQAIEAAGGKVINVQVSENDRGTPGTGHVPWDDVFRSLERIRYEGAVVVESFIPTIKSIARAVSQWRPVAPSMELLAQEGARFLRGLLEPAE